MVSSNIIIIIRVIRDLGVVCWGIELDSLGCTHRNIMDVIIHFVEHKQCMAIVSVDWKYLLEQKLRELQV